MIFLDLFMFLSLNGKRYTYKNKFFTLQFSALMILMTAFSNASDIFIHDGMDILIPYRSHHGPKHRTHRDVQTCQSVIYNNVTHSLHAAVTHPTTKLPLVESYFLMKEAGTYWQKHYMKIHHFIINNPLTSLSVLEPGHSGTCKNGSWLRATVTESSRQMNCLVSVNGGYFNTHTGECHGNIISNNFLIQDSGGIQNAHFGITDKGNIYTGYLSELDLITKGFVQLVGGVIWLVRDGKNYVEESKKLECSDTEETGTIDRFANVISARTAIGHDKDGRVHVLQVDGKTDLDGISLYDLADLLIELGVVNAINLDGGGSSTAVVNGTMVSLPSDQCPDKIHNCERAVSTIVCVHEPACPDDCFGHGLCKVGVCQCKKPWTGPSCNVLDPSKNCGSHGRLHGDICDCDRGWKGGNCSLPCSSGSYGLNCSMSCLCAHAEDCDVVTGACFCGPGYFGKYCEKKCPYGFYGQNCKEVCFCWDNCFCDPVTGSCNFTNHDDDYVKAGECLARQKIAEEQLVPERQDQYSLCLTSLVCLSIIATASLILNAVFSVLMFKQRRMKPRTEKIRLKKIKRRQKRPKVPTIFSSSSDVESPIPNGFLNKVSMEEEVTITGSGEEEVDVFIARKKTGAL